MKMEDFSTNSSQKILQNRPKSESFQVERVYPTNSITIMLDRIAEQACEPLDDAV